MANQISKLEVVGDGGLKREYTVEEIVALMSEKPKIEADLSAAYSRLQSSRAAFHAYLYGTILGTLFGLCVGFILGVYFYG